MVPTTFLGVKLFRSEAWIRLSSPGFSGVGPRLAIGWTMGTLVSALGVYLSLQIDLPTGATIVCTFGIILVLMAAVRGLLRRTLA
jgi:hypothetical protein